MQQKTKKVTVYSTPYCPWCQRAKDFLKDKGVDFDDVDVSQDHDAAHFMVEKTGQRGVPVIQIGDQFIVGFNRDKIVELLAMKE